jgi:hypothetical protein
LPPTDPRYLSMTPFDLEVEYWTHYYADNNVSSEIEDDQFDKDALLKKYAAEAGDDDWETVEL